MSVEKKSFEFAEKVQDIGDLCALEALFLEYLRPLGGEIVFVGAFILPGGLEKPQALFGTLDSSWFRHYSAERLFLEDPAARHAKTRTSAFTWRDVVEWGDLTPGERRVMSEPANFGLKEGLVVPVHGAEQSLYTVTVTGRDFKVDVSTKTAIALMSRCAVERMIRFLPRAGALDGGEVTLSPRQRECLNWVQYGKSDKEIAAILDISPHTVKEHIEAAAKALGVGSRTEAMVHARQSNLIGLVPLASHRARARSAAETLGDILRPGTK